MCGPCEGGCWELEQDWAGEAEYNSNLAAEAQAEAEAEAEADRIEYEKYLAELGSEEG